MQHGGVLLNMPLRKGNDQLLHLRVEGLQHGVLEQGGVPEDVLNGVIKDGGFHRGELPLDDEGILIFGAVGLLDIGGDAQVLLRVFAVGL